VSDGCTATLRVDRLVSLGCEYLTHFVFAQVFSNAMLLLVRACGWLHVAVDAGFGGSRIKHLREYLKRAEGSAKFTGPLATSLDDDFETRWIRFARSKGRWQRSNSWLHRFGEFARRLASSEGMSLGESCDAEAFLESSRVCFLFLLAVAREQKGFTRVRSARRFLSEERLRLGLKGFSADKKIDRAVDRWGRTGGSSSQGAKGGRGCR
jgi:hypothetical protein